MYFLIKELLKYFKNKSTGKEYISASIGGLLYELVLLSIYTDFWIKGFLSILPIIPLLVLKFIKFFIQNKLKETFVVALLYAFFITGLYDWRLQISGIVLSLIFLLGITSFSFILRILRKKTFWIIFFISFCVWCILWLIPHLFAIYLYSLSFTRGVTLPVIVGDYSFTSVFGLYSPDKFLRSLYFLLICGAFSSLLLYHKRHHLYKFVMTTSIVLILLISITWDLGPLKFIHEFLVSLSFDKYDIGTLFRTHKVFTGITLPLTVTLFSLSINQLLSKLESIRGKQGKVIALALISLFIGLIAWKVTVINNTEGKITIIPQEYFEVANWLKDKEGCYRILWLPRTGKYSPGENPIWFKTKGWGILETSLGLRTYYYYGRPMEYMYPFLMRMLEANKTKTVACVLSHMGVKYLVIHDDYWWDRLLQSIERIKANLNSSPYFRLVYFTNHIYVYENLLTNQCIFISTEPVIVSGGLRSLSIFEESPSISLCRYQIFFSDLVVPIEVMEKASLFIATSLENLKYDILTNLLISEGKEDMIIVPTYFTKGIERGRWHPFYIDNPHHAEWEVFYTWDFLDARFEHSFRFDWGFVGSETPGEKLEIPVNVKEGGNYIILIRYLKSSKGGKIELKINNISMHILTLGKETSFEWFVANITLKRGTNTLELIEVSGKNAINVILVIPSKDFVSLLERVDKVLEGKNIILLENSSKTPFSISEASENIHVVVKSIEYNGCCEYILRILSRTKNITLGITIPEQYHGGWIAIVDKKMRILSTQHLFVNNFWIRLVEPGEHEIKIVFIPQQIWEVIYITNLAILVIILLVLLITWFKQRLLDESWSQKVSPQELRVYNSWQLFIR